MTAWLSPLPRVRALLWAVLWYAIATAGTLAWWQPVFFRVPFMLYFAAVALTGARGGPVLGMGVAVAGVATVLGMAPAEPSAMLWPSVGMLITSALIVVLSAALRRSTRAVSENQFFHQNIAEAVADFVWSCDPQGRPLYLSPRTLKYFGRSMEELGAKGWQETIHPDDLPLFLERFGAANRTGETFDFELRRRRHDGVFRWFHSRGVAIRDDAGQVVKWLGTSTDVHLRKQALEELEEQRRLLQAVIDHTPATIYVKDANGHLLLVNERFCRSAGLPKEQIIHRHEREIFSDPQLGEILARDQRILAGNVPFEGEETLRLADGEHTFLSIKVPVEDVGFPGRVLVGVSTEITARKRDERALREWSERLALAMEQARLGEWSWDAATDALTLSARACEILGVPAETNLRWAELAAHFHEDDRERAREARERALAGRTDFDIEYRVRRLSDAAEIWISAKGRGQYAADGRVLSMFGVLQEITERKRSEQEREQLLARERQARSEAEHAGRMKDEFLATLSHELRTPLNAIVGWVQLLKDEDVGEAEWKEGLAVIERNTRVQTQLIEDLLDMSRIISGKLRLDVQNVDFLAVIEAAIESVRPSAEARSIRIHKVLDPLRSPLRGDAARLQQVIWNLLSNAIKFTPKGGRVEVALERVNSHVELTVSDNGAGIPEELLPHIFERFRQKDSSTTRRHGGLGLGLAIVKQLVELHGGTVLAQSAGEGRGAAFRVTLPLPVAQEDPDVSRAHPAISSQEIPAATPRLDGVRILIVDDEPDSREIVCRILRGRGAAVQAAASAAEALEALTTRSFEVLVSDIGMPEVDGYELIRRVRATEATHALPAIALTAFARSEDRQRAMLAGFDTFLSKPVESAELLAVVARCADRAPR